MLLRYAVDIPPKYRVAHTIRFLKGKSEVRIYRDFAEGAADGTFALLGWAFDASVAPTGCNSPSLKLAAGASACAAEDSAELRAVSSTRGHRCA